MYKSYEGDGYRQLITIKKPFDLTTENFQSWWLEHTKITKKLPNLRYLGEISFEETNILLSKSSIFINTSLELEGFPNTYIQAWMRETPVIALNFDPDNLIKKNKIGFHSGTFQQMVKDVRYLIKNDNIRNEMGKRARQYAIENHNIKRIGERYIEIFERLGNQRSDHNN